MTEPALGEDLPLSAPHPLAATLFSPPASPNGAVLIAGAMGVPRAFYAAFAQHLASQGFATLILDYRGIGGSAPASLRGFEASVHRWAEEDLGAALDALERRFPRLPLLYVGHSIGGQLLALVPRLERVSAALLVASQSGYWRLWPGAGKYAIWALWHLAVPFFTRTLGFLPLGRLGMGEDVPSGVAREWAQWGRDPKYVFSYAAPRGGLGFGSFQRPLRSYAISDDRYAPEPTVRALVDFFTATRGELRVVEPHHAGAKKIGHFGFFRPRFRDTLWKEAAAWLHAQLPPPGTAPRNVG